MIYDCDFYTDGRSIGNVYSGYLIGETAASEQFLSLPLEWHISTCQHTHWLGADLEKAIPHWHSTDK